MNRQEGIKLFSELHAIWPRQTLSEESINAYLRFLEDLPLEAVLLAVADLACAEDFLPSIALLRSTSISKIPSNRIPSTDEAWNEVDREARRIGNRRHLLSPNFSHPAILDAIDSVGWSQLVLSESPGIQQSQFFKVYPQIAKRYRQELLKTPKALELETVIKNQLVS